MSFEDYAEFGVGLIVGVLLMLGAGGLFWLFADDEPKVSLARLAAMQPGLASELRSLGQDDISVSALLDHLATREQQQAAEETRREAARRVELAEELRRREAAYKNRIPDELQVVIDKRVAAAAQARAEAETGLTEARTTIARLSKENAELRGLWKEAREQAKAADVEAALLPALRTSLSQLSVENEALQERLREAEAELRATAGASAELARLQTRYARLSTEHQELQQLLSEAEAEARSASHAARSTPTLHSRIIELTAEQEELRRRVAALCRERARLIRLLDEAASGETIWRESPRLVRRSF